MTSSCSPPTGDLLAESRRSRALPSPPLATAIRREANVSRDRMAEHLGVHPITVARWERGTRTPRGRLRLAYAQLLEDLRREVSAT